MIAVRAYVKPSILLANILQGLYLFHTLVLLTLSSFLNVWAGNTIRVASSISQRSETCSIANQIGKRTRQALLQNKFGQWFCQSHQLHTDTSQSGPNLSDKLFIGSHPRGSDCCAHLWRAATVLLKSLQLALRVWVGC